MGVNGKSKGNSFERKIALTLSERFESLLGIKTSFRRNPDSGSYFGGNNVQRIETYDLDYAVFGDLICPRSFLFSIECKHYKAPPSYKAVMSHAVTQWDLWLKQAEQDSTSSKKLMSLIIKYNNVEEMVFLKKPLENVYHARYQDYYIHTLNDWLKQPDGYFFNIELVQVKPLEQLNTVSIK